jgi:hypothetical protein
MRGNSMRITMFMAFATLAFGPVAFAQSGRLPVTAPPPVSIVRVNPASGTAQGYIFWAKNDFKYNDQTVCQDLTVSVGAGGGGGADNHTTYITAGPYAGCAYSVGALLEGWPAATVRIHFWPAQLTPSDFKILETSDDLVNWVLPGPTSGPACTNTQPANPTNPSPSDLTAPIRLCGDNLYNFNVHLYNQANGMPATGNIPVTRVSGPVRVGPGTPVQSGASNGMLLAPGSQPTMLGGAGGSAANGSSGMPAVQRQAITNGAITDGTRSASTNQVGPSQMMSAQGNGSAQPGSAVAANPTQTTTGPMPNSESKSGPAPVPLKGNGRNEYDAITAQRGVTQEPGFATWANSGQQPGATGSVTQPGTLTAARLPAGIQVNPNVYVAQACAKDNSYRVLFISGTSDGSLTVGPQYTLWGCSFGNPPSNKAPTPPVRQSLQTGPINPPGSYYVGLWLSMKPQFTGLIYADIRSWSDNAIVIAFPASAAVTDSHTPLSGPAVPTELWLTRADGQTIIYGHEGGLSFKPAN